MQGASRLSTIGSIFSRLNGLLSSGIVKFEERPIWFDIYKAFPPNREPIHRTVVSGDEIPAYNPPKILYYEDQIRSKFYSEIQVNEIHDLSQNDQDPIDRVFINTFYELQSQGITEKNLFKATIQVLQDKGYYLNFKNQQQN